MSLSATMRAKNSLRKTGYVIDHKPIDRTQSLDPVAWIEDYCYLYDTGAPMRLFECQVRPLQLALSRDDNGNYRYNTILWSWPKKSAKSSVVASVADFIASNRTRASVKLVANDLKQADSRVGYYLRESIRLGQQEGKRPNIQVSQSGYKVRYPNGAHVECVPIDPTGEAGGNDDMTVFSELWGWKSKAHQRMWSEMTLSPTKWGNSQRWIDTYAGIEGESPILEFLYETGVKNGRLVWDDLEVYVNDAAKMLAVWVTKPMFPWQTPEYYAEESSTLTEEEYGRMHGNRWGKSSEAFIPIEWWKNATKQLPSLDRRGVVIGLDAAVSNDCFALVVVSVTSGRPELRHAKVWYPPEGGKIDFDEVEIELLKLFKEYNVVEVAYDPYQLESMAQRLGGNVFWNSFNQGAPRLVADKQLYDYLRDQRVDHDGSFPDVEDHIKNANRKPEDKNQLRIVKRNEHKKIDLVVALSMAVSRALYYNL